MLDQLSAENISDEGGQHSEEEDNTEESKFGFTDAQLQRCKALYDLAKKSMAKDEFFGTGEIKTSMEGYILNESIL
jgi:hypothetical protein